MVLYEPYLVERCQVLLQTSQGMHCQQQQLLLLLQPPSLVSWYFFAFVVLSKIPSISAAKKKNEIVILIGVGWKQIGRRLCFL